MAYRQDLEKAARRHLKAAQVLHDETGPGTQPGCRAAAAYLFGIAGELAVKQLMRDSGMKPPHAHFPELKSMLADTLIKGRRAGPLRGLLEDPRLFQNWDIAMRYAPTEDIEPHWITAWKASAEELVKKMETG